MQTANIFQAALQLSPLDKAKLLDLLLQSFSGAERISQYEQEWAEHAEKICERVDAKQEALYSLEAVMNELNQ